MVSPSEPARKLDGTNKCRDVADLQTKQDLDLQMYKFVAVYATRTNALRKFLSDEMKTYCNIHD